MHCSIIILLVTPESLSNECEIKAGFFVPDLDSSTSLAFSKGPWHRWQLNRYYGYQPNR